MSTDTVSSRDIQQAYEREQEEAARVIALDSAARAATLEHGDEFASALRQSPRMRLALSSPMVGDWGCSAT